MSRPVSTRFAVALLVLAACSPQADSSEKADTATTPQTPAEWVAESNRLRREGSYKPAVDAALEAFKLAGSGPRVQERLALAKAFGAGGNPTAAINEIKEMEKERTAGTLQVDEVDIAAVYAQIGDNPAVFRWLDRAVTKNSPELKRLHTDPDFEPAKADPRWADIIAKAPQQ